MRSFFAFKISVTQDIDSPYWKRFLAFVFMTKIVKMILLALVFLYPGIISFVYTHRLKLTFLFFKGSLTSH